jgi:hypothetical protein
LVPQLWRFSLFTYQGVCTCLLLSPTLLESLSDKLL